MSQRGHILVTPKGMELQATILTETGTDFPKITATLNSHANSTLTIKKKQPLQSTFNLTSYNLPKAGYFGPKKPTQSILSPEAQAYNFYPSYMNKNPVNYPERHCCAWEPISTTHSEKKITSVMPKGKYIHHTLYNAAVEQRLYENPSIPRLNKTAQGLRAKTANVELRTEETDVSQFRDTLFGGKDTWKTSTSEVFPSNVFLSATNKPQTAAAGLRFRGTMKDWEQKEEKYMQTYQAHQKDFNELMDRLETETNKKLNRYQEDQHIPREFIKEFKKANEELDQIDDTHFKQELRYSKRLQLYQKGKYGNGWKKMENGIQMVVHDKEKKEEKKATTMKEVRAFRPTTRLDTAPAKIIEKTDVSVVTNAPSEITDNEFFVLKKRAKRASQFQQKLSFGSTEKLKELNI